MSELVMSIETDKESYDSALNEIKEVMEKYPEISEEIIISIGKYLEFYPILNGGNKAVVMVGVSSKFYDFIGSIIGVNLLNVTTDYSKNGDFVEVAND